MTTDTELLERAAKVAGYSETKTDERGWFYVCTYPGDPKEWELWTPLEDDGAAFRLAVKLGLTINPYKRGVFVSRDESEPVICEEWGDEDGATTRRAIVLAAAAMPV